MSDPALKVTLAEMIWSWVRYLRPRGVGEREILAAFQGFDPTPDQATIHAALKALVYEPVASVGVPKKAGRPPTTGEMADFANRFSGAPRMRWPEIVAEWLRLHPQDKLRFRQKTLAQRIRGAWRRQFGDKSARTKFGPNSQ